jgi:amphiphysin
VSTSPPHRQRSFISRSESSDAEFDEYQRDFTQLELSTEKMLKELKAFTEAVIGLSLSHLPPFPSSPRPTDLFTAGDGFAQHFQTLFHPIAGEFDLIGKYPDSRPTVRNVDAYANMMDEVKLAIGPELELIETRIVGPVKELRNVMKMIRKSMTKRDHKVCFFWGVGVVRG